MMNTHGGNLRWAKQQFGDRDYLDFSANINPLGIPKTLQASWRALLESDALMHYPDIECTRLREAIGCMLDVSPDCILCGNGASELLGLAIKAKKPKNVLLIEPCFAGYAFAAESNQANPIRLVTNADQNFEWNIEDLDLQRADMLVLGNPNNPTSRGMTKSKLCALLDACHDAHVDIVVDEAFIDLTCSGVSVLDFAAQNEHVIIVRAFTKSLAIPGVRLGYAVGSGAWLRAMKADQTEWSVNVFAQAVAEVLPDLADYQSKTRAWLMQTVPAYKKQMDQIRHLSGYEPQCNFMLWHFDGKEPHILAEKMAKKGVLIRSCQNFYGLNERYFRTAIRFEEENNRLFAALQCCLE